MMVSLAMPFILGLMSRALEQTKRCASKNELRRGVPEESNGDSLCDGSQIVKIGIATLSNLSTSQSIRGREARN